MSVLECPDGGGCPFLYVCIDKVCVHDDLLPPTAYTAFIYLLIPILLSLANVGGLSGGFLKVPIMMDLLNYTESIATFYTYPLTFGGGLANFFLLVPQRHPTEDRPVIDYNLVNVLLPCVVVGTTIGVICNLLVPELANDILIIVLFSFITYLFIQKYLDYRLQLKIDNGQLSKQLLQNSPQRKKKVRPPSASSRGSDLDLGLELVRIIEVKQQENQIFDPNNTELEKLLLQDKGMRLKDVGISFAIFIVFELLSMLIQGKLYHFKLCTPWFFAALFVSFMTLFFIFLVLHYFFLRKRFIFYQKIQYKYPVDLSVLKNYILLSLGGLLGGFSSGLLGLGCGHIMILFMGVIGVQAKVASATSGYQILFIGSASLIQAVIQHSLTWVPLVFFSLLAFIGSFILSIVAYKICETLPNKGQGIIIIILVCLSVINIIGVIPNMILTSKYYGFQSLLQTKGFSCAH